MSRNNGLFFFFKDMNKVFLVPSSLRQVTKYLLICYLATKHSLEILVLNAVLILFNIFSFEEYKPMVRNGYCCTRAIRQSAVKDRSNLDLKQHKQG